MPPPATPSRPASQGRFLRMLVLGWAGLLVALLLGVVFAPYAGRTLDGVLHQTVYRAWKRVTLDAEHLVDDRSTPLTTVQSYYSTLYWGRAAALEALTDGGFRLQIQARLQAGAVAAGTETPTYRSYILLESQEEQRAAVLEKFHLFWQNGLRFTLQHTGSGWVITQVDPVP